MHGGGTARRPLVGAVALLSLLVFTGCPDDPYDPQTWIDKLDDPHEVEKAVTQLERFEDPVAIEPLAKTWEEHQRATRVLRIIIKLAAQDEEGEGKHWEDGPYWDEALPVLITAVEDLDVGDQRSIENASLAADALGEAGDPSTIPVLVKAVNTEMPKLSQAQRVRLMAIRSLGKFGDHDRAVDTLIQVLEEEPKDQRIELFAAAALALGESRSEKAIVPLLEAMFKVGPIFPQVRRAIVGIGPPAVPHLVKVFNDQHKEINALARKNKFNVNCWPDGKGPNKQAVIGPGTTCQHPTNLQFKSASLLGDLVARKAVPTLLEGLDDVPLPAFFNKNIPGPSQHNAILDALRKIQPEGNKAAAKVRRMYLAEDTDDAMRPLTIDVYSFLAKGPRHLDEIAERMSTTREKCRSRDKRECPYKWEGQIRMSAAIAYGRLADEPRHLRPLKRIIAEFRDYADELDEIVEKKQKKKDAAQEKVDAAQKKVAEAGGGKKKAEGEEDDDKKSPAEKKLAALKKKLQAAKLELQRAESNAANERSQQRAYEQALARVAVGIECKKDPECHVSMVTDEDEIFGALKKHLDKFDDMSENDRKALKLAAADRALLEIIKMKRAKGSAVTEDLLAEVDSTQRIVRQGILMALIHSAELPCDQCRERLTEVIEKQKDDSTLRALTVETETARNYFIWAGKQ